MTIFLLIGFVAVWLYLSPKVSVQLFRNSSTSKFKRYLCTIVICIAPFAHELYVYFGFKAYCSVYGGTILVEPISTDRLAFNIAEVQWPMLLAHPQLRHVLYTGNDERKLHFPAVSLSSNPSDCQSATQSNLSNSQQVLSKWLVYRAAQKGFCYTETLRFEQPMYELQKGTNLFKYQDSSSLLYPREVRTIQHFKLVDKSNGIVKSSFLNWETPTGFLVDILLPQKRTYGCSTINSQNPSPQFPFDQNVYRFLKKAILEG